MNIKGSHSFIWRIFQQYSSYIVKIIVQTILARILNPNDFGVIAIVMAFISIADILAVSGMGTALVQKKNPDQSDYATAFTSSMFFSCLLYFILFLSAPLISEYYKIEGFQTILRVYGILIFIQSYAAIQNAFVLKHFELKKSFQATLLSSLISGSIAIIIAICGGRIWALVLQSIMAGILSIVFLHKVVLWKPKIQFEMSRFKKLFSFSWKVLLSSLLGIILENIYNLSIGKIYGKNTLGLYNRGNSYASAVIGQTTSALGVVVLPVYSALQDDKVQLTKSVRRMTHITTFILFPMAVGLFAVSDSFVRALLTEKWLGCVFYLRLECIFYAALILSTIIGQGIVAVGRSDIGVKIETVKLLTTVFAVVFFNRFGIKTLCIIRIIIALSGVVCALFISKKLIGYRTFDMIKDIAQPLFLSLFMGGIVYSMSGLPFPSLIVLGLQCIVGVGIYFISALVFMRGDLQAIRRLLKGQDL